MNTQELIELENNVLLGNYARPDFVLTHGKGMYLYDADGKEYLDFVGGIAVNAFGYGDERTLQVLHDQAAKLWHCSNLYHNEPQVLLAQFLTEHTFADKVFFCNSGTEANEAAIKFCRKWATLNRGPECMQIISFTKSFHGRTYGALSATGQSKLQDNFGPMLPGFAFAEFNNLESVQKLVNDQTCAIIAEPVQGEGGIYPATAEFMQGLRALCDERNLLLVLDEVQCGFGRTGKFCACEHFGVAPDLAPYAQPIAGGLPLGAVLLRDKIAAAIKPGDHGCTFGGGPLTTRVALDILQRLAASQFLAAINEKSGYLQNKLRGLQAKFPAIKEVRGLGLMIGVEVIIDPAHLIAACYKQGLLICKTGSNAVRLLPPLIVANKHIDEFIVKFAAALQELEPVR